MNKVTIRKGVVWAGAIALVLLIAVIGVSAIKGRRQTSDSLEELKTTSATLSAQLQEAQAELTRLSLLEEELARLSELEGDLGGAMASGDAAAQSIRSLRASVALLSERIRALEGSLAALIEKSADTPVFSRVSDSNDTVVSMAVSDLPSIVESKNGREAFYNGNYAAAATNFTRAAGFAPDDLSYRAYADASAYMASYQDAGLREAASGSLKALLIIQPSDDIALRTLAHIESDEGEWGKAVGRYKELSEVARLSYAECELAALAATFSGKHADAALFLDMACDIRKEDAHLWYRAGEAYVRAGDMDAAKARFLKCIELDPDNEQALHAISELPMEETE